MTRNKVDNMNMCAAKRRDGKAQAGMPVIELNNITFQYANSQYGDCIKDISLVIPPGEVLLLCGESGCGKTSLTRLINGLIPHYFEGKLSGSVHIDGTAVDSQPLYETARRVGSVFQNPRSQFFTVDTRSELAFGCENMGIPEATIQERIDLTVEEFEIRSLMDRSIFELSGGEKQEIACASVSAGFPDIIVLDEPSSNLDICAVHKLRCILQKWKASGKTIIIAEHRLYYLKDILDRAVYMKNGRIDTILSCAELNALSPAVLATMGLRPLSLATLANVQTAGDVSEDGLSISDMSFSYKEGQKALDIRHLSVPKGSSIAIIGHNGAGKTTFSRCLCGLEKRCRGTLEDGTEIMRGRQRLKNCFMVMQDVNHQLFCESVLDEVMLSMKEENLEKAQRILESLDLLEFQDVHPLSLSCGQKQRVAIACAVASESMYILFDEPTSGLDLRHMEEVAQNLEQLRRMEKTLFIVSHDPQFILACCSYVVHIENGTVHAQYPLDKAGLRRFMDFFAYTGNAKEA